MEKISPARLLRILLSYVKPYAWLGAHILNDIRKEMFRHFQRLSLGFYARSRMGDLLSRFSPAASDSAEGDEGSRFYIIIRGKVAVSATDEEGSVHRVATLDDGDYFGEIALLTDKPTTATVETLVSSIFLILQREQLQKLMHQHSELGAQVRHALKRRLAETEAMTA